MHIYRVQKKNKNKNKLSILNLENIFIVVEIRSTILKLIKKIMAGREGLAQRIMPKSDTHQQLLIELPL